MPPEVKQTFLSSFNNLTYRVGRNIVENDFNSEQEALAFYEELGFTIEAFPFFDDNYPLSTLANTPEPAKSIGMQVLSTTNAWLLRQAK